MYIFDFCNSRIYSRTTVYVCIPTYIHNLHCGYVRDMVGNTAFPTPKMKYYLGILRLNSRLISR